ncbi:MAG: thiamine pyrophosphate-binding protein [Pseudomonadota bacterium]
MEATVSEIIVGYLQQLGIHHVFGVPGAHILPVFDKLYDSNITVILTKHEQGAAFMAGGYAISSGNIGACIATTGPGATNLVTGLANAFVNATPVLAITGETPTYSFGKGALQESSGEGTAINQNDIFRGITKYNKIVQRTDYIPQVLRSALNHLCSVNPGPVLLSFPYNVLREKTDLDILQFIKRPQKRRTPSGFRLSSDLEEIVSMVREAEHPVVIAGYGCILADAEKELSRFCTDQGIPVVTSLKGRGVIPETSDLFLGILGITAKEAAFRYITEVSDLVIFLGVSFGERTSHNWSKELLAGKRIVQVDINPLQLEKSFTPDVAVCGDLNEMLGSLNLFIESNPLERKDLSRLRMYKEKYGRSNLNDEDFSLVSCFLRRLNSLFDGDMIIFDDNIIYMQHFVNLTKSRSYFPNSGISSLGRAVPAAIGAKLTSDKPVFAITGDGGFQMCCMELMTAVNYRIPVTVILLNNSCLGLVRKNQYHNYKGRYIASDFVNPDYKHLAISFGINYRRVSSSAEADKVFDETDFHNEINLIELMMNKDGFPTYSSGR